MTASQPTPDFDVVIVGAGLAGLCALHRLRNQGQRVRVFEAGDGVGGTWYWNRYPGCRCDVESLEYSYSFSDELQQEWHWPERYSTQPAILQYINHVADRFDLRRDIELNTRIETAHFDNTTNCWTVGTNTGAQISATYCIMAVGNLSTPSMPDLPGLKTFTGNCYHSGLWPHEEVDFSGQSVGVIGTGCSGIQMIPIIAQQAKHLYVFQRTAQFTVPACNQELDPQKEREHKENYTKLREGAYETPFGIAGYPPPTHSALEVSAQDREQEFEAKWNTGGNIGFLYAYNDLLLDKASNDTASDFVREKIRSIVKSPDVAELLCPKDHPIGAKRLSLDTHYYETYNRDNVTLVDIKSAPIERVTEHGIRTTERDYRLDALALATGFDAMTGAMLTMDIKTSEGVTLKDKWAQGPLTYLGIMVSGLPNLFMITGPGSPGVKSNMILSIEQHTNWIGDCIAHMCANGVRRIDAQAQAESEWVQHVNEIANATLYPYGNSWYLGANIEGKPNVFMPYVGGVDRYKRKCDEVAQNGYQGFSLSA